MIPLSHEPLDDLDRHRMLPFPIPAEQVAVGRLECDVVADAVEFDAGDRSCDNLGERSNREWATEATDGQRGDSQLGGGA